jgi:hypothetical protein
VKDLLSGDSAKAQLKVTELQLLETEKKVVLKDSIINTMKIKEINYQTIIAAEKEKFQIVENYSKTLEKDLRKERTIKFININYDRNITDNDVADACGIGHWSINNWDKAIGVDK